MLTMCDSGAAIANSVADQLFSALLASQTGLGIGIYQSARQAGQLGYQLALAAKEPGTVCFVPTREAGAT
jgi:C4-dicarboxylate-specific signal transduction histidine kinase